MDTDLFGERIEAAPVPAKRVPIAVVTPIQQEAPATDYSANGAVMPYECWRSGKNTTVIWNRPTP